MKNSAYWRKRFQQLEETQYLQGEEYCKVLREQFRIATNNIQADIEKWYYRLAENNNISYLAAKKFPTKSQLKEFQWTLEEYIKYGQENALNQKWVKELENASAKYHISYLEAMKLQIQQEAEKLFMEHDNGTAGLLKKIYTDSFYHSAYEIAKGTGVGTNLHALNTRQIEKVLKRPWAVDGANYSDRIWKNKEKLLNTLNTELIQNIIRGDSFHDISRRIAKQMDAGMSQAMRLIQTEDAAIAASGQEDCYMEMGIEQFEIVETLDSRTCKFCAYMDGQHFPMTEYKIGTTVPPFHPNCRGCTCPYFNDEFTAHEKRIARGGDGRNYYVPADMTYKEWKKRYVNKDDNKNSKLTTPDFLMRNHIQGENTTKLRLLASNVISKLPIKVQSAIQAGTIIDLGKTGAGQYDYEHDILYISKNASSEEIIHEIGHLVDNKLMNNSRVEQLRKELVSNIPLQDIVIETYYDSAGNPKDIFLIRNDKLISDYQGRLYINDWDEVFNENWELNDKALWEFISESFREYIINGDNMEKEYPKLYKMIKDVVE